MKGSAKISFLFVMALMLFSSVMASDVSKAVIFDVPHDVAVRQFGPDYKIELTARDSLELAAYRFTGDTLKMLVVLVEWYDKRATYSIETFDTVMLSRNIYPTGSVADYFDEVSYGQLAVAGDIYGWHNIGFTSNPIDFEEIIEELDPYIDYSRYDGDGDGNVDAVIFIHAGNGQEDSGNPYNIWSYAMLWPEEIAPGHYDGKRFPRMCTAPETMPLRDSPNPTIITTGSRFNRISVAAHELSHNMGLPVYDHYSVVVEDAGYNPGHDAWPNPEGYVTDSAQ